MATEYCWTVDGENFSGRHATRVDAIQEAKDSTDEWRHDQIETGTVVPRSAIEFFPSANDMVEHAAEHAYNECGDNAADWPEVSDEAEADLDLVLSGFLQSWIMRHRLTPTFYTVGATQPIGETDSET